MRGSGGNAAGKACMRRRGPCENVSTARLLCRLVWALVHSTNAKHAARLQEGSPHPLTLPMSDPSAPQHSRGRALALEAVSKEGGIKDEKDYRYLAAGLWEQPLG